MEDDSTKRRLQKPSEFGSISEFVRDAAVLDEFHAGLEGIDIDRTSHDGFILIERGLNVHSDVVEESLFEKPTDDAGPAAVGVELDARAQTAGLANEPREVFLDCRFAAGDD